ncbi:hypothetical protein DFS33DRAFT_527534 [Desarmillaria ectypa]|nr:hypothetical protein DFS33DRAFT_527534 [Desarmillaria ectypa]
MERCPCPRVSFRVKERNQDSVRSSFLSSLLSPLTSHFAIRTLAPHRAHRGFFEPSLSHPPFQQSIVVIIVFRCLLILQLYSPIVYLFHIT